MSLAEERAGKPFQRPYWLLFSVNLLLSLTLYLSNPLMNLRLNRAGIEAGTAGAVIGSMSLASLLFRPFSGWVCDRFRRKSLLLIFTLLTAVSLGGYGAVNHAALFFLLRILHGVSFGVTTTVTMACVSDYLPEGKEGQGMGVFLSLIHISCSTSICRLPGLPWPLSSFLWPCSTGIPGSRLPFI